MKSLAITTAMLLLFAGPALAQGGHMGGNSSSSTAISGSSSQANNSGNSQRTNFKDRLQAPGVGSVGLTSSGNCPIGSVGVGVSGPGAGFNIGFTRGDEVCRNAYLIERAGFSRKVMQQYLVNEVPAIRNAVFPVAKH